MASSELFSENTCVLYLFCQEGPMDEAELRTELGGRLRAARSGQGRTLADVAIDAGLSVPYVANLESGRGNPTLGALHPLAAALGTPLTALPAAGSDEAKQ